MVKTLSMIAAAAMGAAVVTFMPSFAPTAGANTPAPVVKADRLDFRPIGKACSEQAWPHYETKCLRDRTQPGRQARTVRVITTDKVTR